MSVGFVSLVGAGPGDPDFLTVKAWRRLREADLVLHDALVSKEVCEIAAKAMRIDVGKRAGRDQTPQREIERLLIEGAQQGLRVVRLKGGDPFVFGRGGEEALALHRAGIAFEIVPGVTTAVSAPALAGIPVTHRGVSSGFIVITGTDLDALDSIATGRLTVVVLMGLSVRTQLAQRLIDRGRDPETSAAIVIGAGTPSMWTWRGTLADLPSADLPDAAAAGTIVIGEVTALPIDVVNGRSLSRETTR